MASMTSTPGGSMAYPCSAQWMRPEPSPQKPARFEGLNVLKDANAVIITALEDCGSLLLQGELQPSLSLRLAHEKAHDLQSN
jgi:hypothetical protein